ncbi:MAG: glycosyl hydrolase family 5 [Fibrobacter sp.]|nr:glycosyl hydrolase family 5 [Fibrobacter sp.]
MKHPFLKSALILSAAIALMNCGDDSGATTEPTPSDISQIPVTDPSLVDPSTSPVTGGNTATAPEACFKFDADQTYLINTDLTVTNASGETIGTYDPTTLSIITVDGQVLAQNVNLNELQALAAGESFTVLKPTSSSASVVPTSSATATTEVPASSAATETPAQTASSSSVAVPASSSSVVATEIKDGNVTISGPLSQTVAQNAKTAEIKITGLTNEPTRLSWNAYFLETSYSNGTYIIKAVSVPEYFEQGEVSEFFKIEGKDYEMVLNVTGKGSSQQQAQSSSSQQQAKSSSSQQQQQAQSSASQPKSSASQQTPASSAATVTPASSASTTSAPLTGSYKYSNTAAYSPIKNVAGGRTGSGFASRYWDCCKPSCAWPGKGGKQATACSVSGSKLSDANATSTCNGGSAGTCVSQIPMVVNDTLAYAYAAVPAKDGGQCGKCFALAFTGKGKYETKANHKALAGKTLIVMASNIGEDVAQGQFDIMIPGGGVGLFNGCAAYGWGNMGAQYGGLLTECEKSAGTAGDIKTKRKECLAEKCASTFKNDATAKEGCMFLATWYEAAGNPTHNYREVECPPELSAKF